MSFAMISGAFDPNGAIPLRHTCDGDNISPGLSWVDAPENTGAFALIVDDPDAPKGVFTHWVLYNLPPTRQQLTEGMPNTESIPEGAMQGRNGMGNLGFDGPCPPQGPPHHYHFTLYALDGPLSLQPGASEEQVLDAMRGHILGQAELVGTYQRKAQ